MVWVKASRGVALAVAALSAGGATEPFGAATAGGTVDADGSDAAGLAPAGAIGVAFRGATGAIVAVSLGVTVKSADTS